jgi:hypothetical protein
VINRSLSLRLERLEEQIRPNSEPIIIDFVFVDAAKQQTGGFQVTIPLTGYPRDRRRTGRSGNYGR